jgi:hypothetical protein
MEQLSCKTTILLNDVAIHIYSKKYTFEKWSEDLKSILKN